MYITRAPDTSHYNRLVSDAVCVWISIGLPHGIIYILLYFIHAYDIGIHSSSSTKYLVRVHSCRFLYQGFAESIYLYIYTNWLKNPLYKRLLRE